MTEAMTREATWVDPEHLLDCLKEERLPSHAVGFRPLIHHADLVVPPSCIYEGGSSDVMRFPKSVTRKIVRCGGGPLLRAYADTRVESWPVLGVAGCEAEWVLGRGLVDRETDPTSASDLDIAFANAGEKRSTMLEFARIRGIPLVDKLPQPRGVAAGVRLSVFHQSAARLRFLIEVLDALERCDEWLLQDRRSVVARAVAAYQRHVATCIPTPLAMMGLRPLSAEFTQYLEKLRLACERHPRSAAELLVSLQFTYYAGHLMRTVGYDAEVGVMITEVAPSFLEFVYWRLLDRYRRHKSLAFCPNCRRVFEKRRPDMKHCCANCRDAFNQRERRRKRLQKRPGAAS